MCSKLILLFYLCCHFVFVKTDSNHIPEVPIPNFPTAGISTDHHAETNILTKAEMDEIWRLIPDSDDLDLILEDLDHVFDKKTTSGQIDVFDQLGFNEFDVLFPDRHNSSEVFSVC